MVNSYTPEQLREILQNGNDKVIADALESIMIELTSACNRTPPGLYQHFKGGKYIVHSIGRHSEDETLMVAYQSCDNGQWFFRPYHMFNEEVVNYDGKMVKRFTRL